ncbi:MAG: hypothetical protein WC455_17005 [Dehalococcoidia bacterium]|jgi:hypothetical protein
MILIERQLISVKIDGSDGEMLKRTCVLALHCLHEEQYKQNPSFQNTVDVRGIEKFANFILERERTYP